MKTKKQTLLSSKIRFLFFIWTKIIDVLQMFSVFLVPCFFFKLSSCSSHSTLFLVSTAIVCFIFFFFFNFFYFIIFFFSLNKFNESLLNIFFLFYQLAQRRNKEKKTRIFFLCGLWIMRTDRKGRKKQQQHGCQPVISS